MLDDFFSQYWNSPGPTVGIDGGGGDKLSTALAEDAETASLKRALELLLV